MGRFRTIDMDAADMDAVERAFEADERQELRERVLDILSGVLTAVGAIAFLALCWLLICWREAADSERRARDPQGAEARVERRMMEGDAAYRLCRRAAAVVFALPKEGAW
ncbi:MAG: hypothetical protein Q4G55_08520 [bacterium]|nr:hypothetical protein [bacterium]